MSHIEVGLYRQAAVLDVITDLRMDLDHSVNPHILRRRPDFDPSTAEYLSRLVEKLEKKQEGIDQLRQLLRHMVVAFFDPQSSEQMQAMSDAYDRITGPSFDWRKLVAAIMKDPKLSEELAQPDSPGDDNG